MKAICFDAVVKYQVRYGASTVVGHCSGLSTPRYKDILIAIVVQQYTKARINTAIISPPLLNLSFYLRGGRVYWAFYKKAKAWVINQSTD